MVRVYKSIGAVAVYNAPRAAAVTVAAVIAIGAIGFGVGRIGEGSSSAPRPQAAAPTGVRSGTHYAEGYRQGRVDGIRHATGLERRRMGTAPSASRATGTGARSRTPPVAAGGLAPGPYFVKIIRGQDGGLRLGPNVPLSEGFTYSLCRGAQTVCFRSGQLTPPSATVPGSSTPAASGSGQ